MRASLAFASLLLGSALALGHRNRDRNSRSGRASRHSLSCDAPPCHNGHNVYARYYGIDGESRDRGDGWIDGERLEWAVKRNLRSNRAGTPANVGSLSLRLREDGSYPRLLESLMKGDVIPLLEIDVVGDDRDKTLRYLLSDVKFSRIEVEASSHRAEEEDDEADLRPILVIGHSFEQVRVVMDSSPATRPRNGSNPDEEIDFGWDIHEDKEIHSRRQRLRGRE